MNIIFLSLIFVDFPKECQSFKHCAFLGHVHGTLWANLRKLERMVYSPEGKLVIGTEAELNDPKVYKPFKKITEAFRKLREDVPLDDEELDSLKNLIEEFTTVSLHSNTVGRDVAKIAEEVNVHHHTRTCRKYNNQCRFNYPRYPSHQTIICKPFNGSREERDKHFKKANEILNKVLGILCDDEKMNSIMNKYNKEGESKERHPEFIKERIKKICDLAEVSFDDYVQALSFSKRGYTVVQRRDIYELFVNSYNIEWLKAWNGNMDLQICLDFFSVITYITDYYAKDDSGTMKIINAALAQNECKNVKEQMKLISNTFLTSRQMGEAEAVFRLIPNMTLKGSNVTCQWVSTDPVDERSKRFRKATEEQMFSGIEVFQLGNFFLISKFSLKKINVIKFCKKIIEICSTNCLQNGVSYLIISFLYW